MKVERKKVAAAAMVTIGQTHPAWADPLKLAGLDGAFVRIDPPLNTPDEDVTRLRAMVVDEGAVAVKILPVRRDDTLYREARAEPAAPKPHLSARELVKAMVAESRTRDRAMLERVVVAAMDTARL